jgi:ribosomal-protein-alanine N-acetyltransferase
MTNTSITFRKAKSSDVKELDRLNRANLQENYSEKEWQTVLTFMSQYSYVAEQDNIPVGYILVIRNSMKEALIASFAVSESVRRKRVGSTLMTMALVTLRKAGITKVNLTVRKSNESAQKLYKKFKFQETGVELDYYSNPIEDGLEMTLLWT